MAKIINLSFKETEVELYEYIKGKSSPSIYMKELLERELKNATNPQKTTGGRVSEIVEEADAPKEVAPVKEAAPIVMNLSALKNIGR